MFGQFVQLLLGLNDLFLGLRGDINLSCLGRDVVAQLDQLATDREIVNHLRIIARGIG